MLWFEGSIPEAINSAKGRGLVFVVVITGEDEQSAQLMSSWEDESVSQVALNCCVAIKVDIKSEVCVQFSQIYPVLCVPSSFFIGENGIPLEVIAGSVSAEELQKRIHRVRQMHVQQMKGETDVSETQNSTDTHSAVASAAPVSVSSPENDGSVTASVSEDNAGSDAEENLETKVERINKKLEERQEQKRKGEKEGEIKKEVDRRKVWKEMQDFKRKQEEDKNRRLMDERNREKAEEKAARERVRQQIALDRADRAARYAKTQEEESAARQALLQARQAEQDARKEVTVRQRSTIARIQFRLPDGSSFTNQFSSQSTLQDARQFVVQEVGNRYGNFSLATTFPRREFTNEDLNRTLLELDLAPSASIVLLPHSGQPANAVRHSSEGGIYAVLGSLLYPLLAVWRFLSTFLFSTPPGPPPTSQGSAQQTTSYTNASSASDKAKRETPSKDQVEKKPKDFKKDGKVCRLRTQEDSEDDNNTWNGNSTQQM
ncbi:UBX domain-containing protein 4 [Cynoglossus semilaevis]|uniref:UBX domain-containing protein 4 n=1 Tax=Cynoglossus semilaevis TaxID=244447 RepID=A0A3P8WD28_CYNSE|nr:UBX domain-containing protein 4 [Cynoglossus semilaevis]